MTVRTHFDGRSIDLTRARRRAKVSDHALLRCLERVLGLPVEQIRKDMLTDAVLQGMAMKALSVRASDHQLVFHQHNPFVVITVLTPAMHVRRHRRRKPRWARLVTSQGEVQ